MADGMLCRCVKLLLRSGQAHAELISAQPLLVVLMDPHKHIPAEWLSAVAMRALLCDIQASLIGPPPSIDSAQSSSQAVLPVLSYSVADGGDLKAVTSPRSSSINSESIMQPADAYQPSSSTRLERVFVNHSHDPVLPYSPSAIPSPDSVSLDGSQSSCGVESHHSHCIRQTTGTNLTNCKAVSQRPSCPCIPRHYNLSANSTMEPRHCELL